MKHIVLFGKSGSGKDFLTKKLSEIYRNRMKRFAFADDVKKHIQILLNIPETDFCRFLHDEDYKNHTLVDVSNMRIEVVADVEHKNPNWENIVDAKTLDIRNLEYSDFNTERIFMSLREFTVFYGTKNILVERLGATLSSTLRTTSMHVRTDWLLLLIADSLMSTRNAKIRDFIL